MFSTPLHIGIYRFKEDKQEFMCGLEPDGRSVDFAGHESW